MSLEIRQLAPADAPAYKALRDATLAAFPTAFTSDVAQEALRDAASYASRLGQPGSTAATFTIGAFEAGRLVGALTCEREPRTKVRHVGHLTGMMVDHAAQRRGVGRALLAALLDAARATGELSLLTLTVTAGHAAAIGLYERFGFVRCGTLPRAIRVDGRYHSKDQMALLL